MKPNETVQEIKKLDRKLAQIEAQRERFENQIKTKERKTDTRRKILVGAWAIETAKQEGRLDELYKKVGDYLTRDIDKKLFLMSISNFE
jgi:septal ring factor EnvC (AmiA/AmiB activator)